MQHVLLSIHTFLSHIQLVFTATSREHGVLFIQYNDIVINSHRNPDMNVRDSSDMTPLRLAAKNGHQDVSHDLQSTSAKI